MFLFYAPQIEEDRCFLSPAESLHCARVLRMKAGQEIWVTDGRGHLYQAELLTVSDRCATARIKRILRQPGTEGNLRPRVHIVMAPTKNIDRTEWFLEKAAEVGLGNITFIQTEHSERKVIKTERLEAILVAAMKQSQQAYLPGLSGILPLSEYLFSRFSPEGSLYRSLCSLSDEEGAPAVRTAQVGQVGTTEETDPYPQKFIAYCGPEYPKKEFSQLLRPDRGVEVMIGPEGDFSPAEVELCVQKGYIPVSLGKTRLRTETAALFAAWAPAFLSAVCTPFAGSGEDSVSTAVHPADPEIPTAICPSQSFESR